MTEASNQLALRERSDMLMPATDSWVAVVRDVSTLAAQICDTDFVPADLRWKQGEVIVEDGLELRDLGPAAARVTAVILHGRELGLPPMTALALTHIIEGRPSMYAEAMRAMVFQAGHEIVPVETTSAKCIMKGRRGHRGDWTQVEWTMADAHRLGVHNKKNWLKSPRAMLQARASTELCRLIFPDVIHGMRGVEEFDELEEGTPEDATPQIEGPTIRRGAGRQGTPQVTAEASPSAQRPPQPPPRKRATVPQRGTQPPPEEPVGAEHVTADPQTSPGPGTHPQDAPTGAGADPETPPVDEPSPEPEDQTPPEEPRSPITRGRVASLQMHAGRLGFGDDEQRGFRLTVFASLAGTHPITSTNDLTNEQAVRVLKALEKCRDRAALEEMLEQLS